MSKLSTKQRRAAKRRRDLYPVLEAVRRLTPAGKLEFAASLREYVAFRGFLVPLDVDSPFPRGRIMLLRGGERPPLRTPKALA